MRTTENLLTATKVRKRKQTIHLDSHILHGNQDGGILFLLETGKVATEVIITHHKGDSGAHIDIEENSVSKLIIPIEPISSFHGPPTAHIYDLLGRLQFSTKLAVEEGSNQATLDVSRISAESCLVRIIGGDGILSARVVIS